MMMKKIPTTLKDDGSLIAALNASTPLWLQCGYAAKMLPRMAAAANLQVAATANSYSSVFHVAALL